MTWAARRKMLYILTASFIVLVLGVVLFYTVFSDEPTCSDGARSGGERGVDCGGSCAAICSEDARDPVVLWARPLKIADGFYSAAAYIENRNGGAKAKKARYVFKLVDEKNILVAERYGEVTIAAQRFVPVVESSIATGNRIPARAFFEFIGDFSWEKESEALRVRVTDQKLSEAEGRFEVTIVNDSRAEVRDLLIPAVLFDGEGNAQAASKSVIERLAPGASERVVFTWPTGLPQITRAEVIPYRAL